MVIRYSTHREHHRTIRGTISWHDNYLASFYCNHHCILHVLGLACNRRFNLAHFDSYAHFMAVTPNT